MVDIVVLVMVIASAVSLVVVSPQQAQQPALRALKEYKGMEPTRAYPDEDQAAVVQRAKSA